MSQRHLETMFCDDVRQETSGKFIFVGVYSNDMVVSKFPVTLPKLCIQAKAVTFADDPFQELRIKTYIDDELIKSLAADLEPPDPRKGPAVDERVHTNTMIFTVTDLTLEGPCVIRVRAQTEREEFRGLSLHVLERPIDSGSSG